MYKKEGIKGIILKIGFFKGNLSNCIRVAPF
jgi:hypothetical protein